MPLHALHHSPISPTTAAFSQALRLTAPKERDVRPHRGLLLSHLVTARDDALHVFEVRQAATQVSFYHIASHTCFGIVTGLARLNLASTTNGTEAAKDSLLVSFEDAKIALLEWSHSSQDLETISIHTYERAPQLADGLPLNFRPILSVDPASRCAVLLLPSDSLALLPFYQDTADFELMAELDPDGSLALENAVPYSPSFVLRLGEVDERIRGVRDVVMLPDYGRPTVAVLCEDKATWTGRLNEARDTTSVYLITLDLSISSSHPLIASKLGLPFDALYLTACPAALGGGVVLVTQSALIHLDQSGRIVGMATSKWHSLTSALALSLAQVDGKEACLDLGDSTLAFLDVSKTTSALLTLKNGDIFALEFHLDGRTLASLSLKPRGKTVQPARIEVLPGTDLVFVGSMVGRSEVLLIEQKRDGEAVDSVDDGMDLDEDLYGDTSKRTQTNGHAPQGPSNSFAATPVAALDALGPILDMTPVLLCDAETREDLPLTAVCSGREASASLTLFEPLLRPRKKRRLALDAPEGIWTISEDSQHGTLLLTSTAEASELCMLGEGDKLSLVASFSDRTLAAGSVGSERIARVGTDGVEVLDLDGEVVVEARRREGRKVYSGVVHGDAVVLIWDDGRRETLRFERLAETWTELGEEGSALAVALCEDRSGVLGGDESQAVVEAAPTKANTTDEEEEIDYGDGDDDEAADKPVPPAADEKKRQQWLWSVTSAGQIELFSLPTMQRKWKSETILAAPTRLGFSDADESADEDEVGALQLAEIAAGSIGDGLYLAATFTNGLLIVYEGLPVDATDEEDETATPSTTPHLPLTFFKVLSRQLHDRDVSLKPPDGEAEAEARTPLRFVEQLDALFVGGPKAGFVMRSRTSPLRYVGVAEKEMEHVAARDGQRLLYSSFGMVFSAEIPPPDLSKGLPSHTLGATGRTYNKVAAHPPTRTLVAASLNPMQFQLFDPEDQKVVRDPADDPSPPVSYRGAIELFIAGSNEPIDGFELDQNEIALCVESVSLFSTSTVSGVKDYIAVGTMMSHGEDRPVRGATYIFDVIEMVPDPADPVAKYKLRLINKDAAKGPIHNISDINGYLVNTMGQKLFVRALEGDLWLVTIAFLDMPFHCTHMRRLKNFLLLTDIRKSVWFVGFQEEPYKLVLLSKDYNVQCLTSAEYLVWDDQLSFVTMGADKVLRLLDYNPALPASQNGAKLILRTEYRLGAEVAASMMVPGEEQEQGGMSLQAEVLLALTNGGIDAVLPVTEETFKRLQLLQGQLVRNALHFAGLNPRGFRAIRNDSTSRSLTKGILDGALLASFESLARPKMEELASLLQGHVGGADALLRELARLRSHWGV